MIRIVRVSFLLALLVCSLPAQELRDGGNWILHPPLEESSRSFPAFVTHVEVKRPRIGLVLSGGGARGIASIGVLKAFEKANLPIDFIVGTSIGSIVGGLYAAGYSVEDLTTLVDSTNWREILSLSDESRRADLFFDQKLARDKNLIILRFEGFEAVLPEAFSTGQRLTNYLNVLALQGIYHPLPSFDDLRIPFRSVATDLVSGKRVVIDKGDLSEALRASVTVPLLFSTVKKDSMQLLDGGLVSNIPADVARQWGADIVVVVDVTSPLRTAANLNAPWEYADQIIGITMQFMNEQQLKNADFVIRPGLGNHLSTDFENPDSLISLGEQAAAGMVDSIQREYRMRSGRIESNDSGSVLLPNATVVLEESQKNDPVFAPLLALDGTDVSENKARFALGRVYESGPVHDVQMEIEEKEGRTLLRPKVNFNPVLRKIKFNGVTLLSLDTLNAIVAPLIGHMVNYHECRNALVNILEIYRQNGYSMARIRSADLDSVSGDGTVEIDEGVVFERRIVGSIKTKDYVVWRELPWDRGEVFNVFKVAASLSNLYGTSLFEQVSISVTYEGEDQDRLVVIIHVRERSTDLIRLGMTVDNERNVQPSIDIRDENFLGIASELGIHFFGGLRNRSYVAEFKANRIFNSFLTFGLRAHYNLKDINVFKDDPSSNPTRWNRVRDGEYREVREGATLSFGTQLERLGQVTMEAKSEHQRVWSIFNQPIATESFHVTSIKLGTRIDSRDRFPYPREGVELDLSYESGFVTATDRLGFTKLFFNYASYSTFFRRQTLSPRIRFGYGDETVPVTEMFSLGGQDSFFGFREDDARGRQLVALSLEYRYFLPIQFLFDMYIKLRYDLGHIWEKAEQVRIKDMRHGIGFGIGLDTPIGPAEVSVGRAFFIRKDLFDNPLSYGPVVAYFRIGYAF